MIKSILNKGDIESLNMLFNIFILANDEKEILHIAGKLYIRANEYDKERLIEIGDRVHEILLKYRNTYKNIYNEIEELTYHGNFVQVRFLKTYLETFSEEVLELIFKLLKEMKKAYSVMVDINNVEVIVFLNINIADYLRYCCEICLDENSKKELVLETKKRYEMVFQDMNTYGISIVNPSNLVANYHYSIFLYEIMEDRVMAIKLLKNKHQEIINNLDIIYKVYVDCYDILDSLTSTLTGWVIENNYGGINDLNAL